MRQEVDVGKADPDGSCAAAWAALAAGPCAGLRGRTSACNLQSAASGA